MELRCQYCGKIVRHEHEYNAKKMLISHLKYCKVRKAGIDFTIGSERVNVKARSIRCVNDLKQILVDMSELPAETQKAVFTGVLITEQRHKRIRDFSFH